MRTNNDRIQTYIIYKNSDRKKVVKKRKEVTMFPTELELEQHRQDMIRTAENQRLVNFVQAGNERTASQPTVWQRLRVRLNGAQAEQSGAVAIKRTNQAIA